MADQTAQTGEQDGKIPAELLPHIKELREENKNRRLENKSLDDENKRLAKEVEAMTKRMAEQDERFKALAGVKPEDKTTDPVKVLSERVETLQQELQAERQAVKDRDAKVLKATILGEVKAKVQPILADGVDLTVPLKLMDLGKITVDSETLEVNGAEEAIAEVQKLAPQLFGNKRIPAGTPGGGNRSTPAGEEDTSMSGSLLKGFRDARPSMPPGTLAPTKKGTTSPVP